MKLSRAIDWRFLEAQFASVYSDGPGCPPAHTLQIKRELRRRAAIEPVIGHLKAEHGMGRNYLAHHAGDAVNAVLAAAGYYFHLLPKWLELLLFRFLAAQKAAADLQWV